MRLFKSPFKNDRTLRKVRGLFELGVIAAAVVAGVFLSGCAIGIDGAGTAKAAAKSEPRGFSVTLTLERESKALMAIDAVGSDGRPSPTLRAELAELAKDAGYSVVADKKRAGVLVKARYEIDPGNSTDGSTVRVFVSGEGRLGEPVFAPLCESQHQLRLAPGGQARRDQLTPVLQYIVAGGAAKIKRSFTRAKFAV